MKAQPGQPAPQFSVSDWVQGEPVSLGQLSGRVVLLEIFQVNCPGCFLYALPQAIDLHQRYRDQGLTVIGIATAFEDFNKNTLANLQLLVERQEVIGETLHQLRQHKLLTDDGRLPYAIPFPLAMDRLVKRDSSASPETELIGFIEEHFPDFGRFPPDYQEQARRQIRDYLAKLDYHAETFEMFGLKGTPSQILIDKKSILQDTSFGVCDNLESKILQLLEE